MERTKTILIGAGIGLASFLLVNGISKGLENLADQFTYSITRVRTNASGLFNIISEALNTGKLSLKVDAAIENESMISTTINDLTVDVQAPVSSTEFTTVAHVLPFSYSIPLKAGERVEIKDIPIDIPIENLPEAFKGIGRNKDAWLRLAGSARVSPMPFELELTYDWKPSLF